ncbi:unnamed protein product [Effrenium voratum]|uniref:Uncharacterized protein n=1 Tax=Effrenium voratum TaxID=2562239 RepID=A0AA36MYI9_9DINO|nr:unnamed protein product [Effrenium voratum]
MTRPCSSTKGTQSAMPPMCKPGPKHAMDPGNNMMKVCSFLFSVCRQLLARPLQSKKTHSKPVAGCLPDAMAIQELQLLDRCQVDNCTVTQRTSCGAKTNAHASNLERS